MFQLKIFSFAKAIQENTPDGGQDGNDKYYGLARQEV